MAFRDWSVKVGRTILDKSEAANFALKRRTAFSSERNENKDIFFEDRHPIDTTRNVSYFWIDGTYIWFISGSQILPYNLETLLPNFSIDINFFVDDIGTPEGLWSDGETMYLVSSTFNKIFAWNIATRLRDSGKDFDTLEAAGNTSPRGLWSDGETMYVMNSGTLDQIFAYDMETKLRDETKEFDGLLLLGAGVVQPFGIWGDDETLWVSDDHVNTHKIHAFNRETKQRDPSKDFDTLVDAGNITPRGLGVDGETMYVADPTVGRFFAYEHFTSNYSIDINDYESQPKSSDLREKIFIRVGQGDNQRDLYASPENVEEYSVGMGSSIAGGWCLVRVDAENPLPSGPPSGTVVYGAGAFEVGAATLRNYAGITFPEDPGYTFDELGTRDPGARTGIRYLSFSSSGLGSNRPGIIDEFATGTPYRLQPTNLASNPGTVVGWLAQSVEEQRTDVVTAEEVSDSQGSNTRFNFTASGNYDFKLKVTIHSPALITQNTNGFALIVNGETAYTLPNPDLDINNSLFSGYNLIFPNIPLEVGDWVELHYYDFQSNTTARLYDYQKLQIVTA